MARYSEKAKATSHETLNGDCVLPSGAAVGMIESGFIKESVVEQLATNPPARATPVHVSAHIVKL